MGKIALFGDFGGFGAFLGPWGLPGTPPGRGFYINPSRRGPAVPRGSREGSGASAAQARGTPPEEGVGGLPLGVAVGTGLPPGPRRCAVFL